MMNLYKDRKEVMRDADAMGLDVNADDIRINWYSIGLILGFISNLALS